MNVEPGLDEPLGRLRQFLLLDIGVSLIATVFVFVVYLFLEPNEWLLAACAMAGGAACLMAMGLRPLQRGEPVVALWWMTSGNWSVALGASFIATFAWPIQIIAAILPVVVAVPYVTARQFRLMILGAVFVFTGVALLGTLQDVTGLTGDVPEWLTDTVLIVFMPFMAVLITQAGARTAEALRDSLAVSLAANRGLQESERLLAEQAALLRESRSRLVAAADDERRRIERDLHDGAQQRLVGLSLQISLAREQAVGDPAAAQVTLDRIRDEVRHAQNEMRALVQGLYPPVLTQHGLGPAMRSMVGGLPNPVRTRIDDVARLDADREASLYFFCLEAVQNVMKHAPGAAVEVSLVDDGDDNVVVTVRDDGPGFDPAAVDGGAGLVNMADRIGAAGGDLEVTAAPGDGTTLTARMPRPARPAASPPTPTPN